ncbi:MAG: type I glyceraldehyde-3-phosphate dehydrogenase [Candidatus Yanofskybacteria bacterium RIFCSPHIGHO2_02_FULL_43_22]|uniref:Type I glyceraldehyde-3-phosphate dehydrogenase n=1 Tax=Candidatus Yanofskybacteria bacterium RIFCSPHIGHO2_02_FULL_43_22 TaxID=1802681 RepID=A0A1F8FJX3_9BACT|nr:MAG: type I glyceraldehyde-3-phosphate dehydrogenase [Candidatus Yanofskybacteria bacterium RIFCSPHIGHO2_02_FULL_43_22]
MPKKISINGFGRIGRAFFKLAVTKPELEIVAINDLGDLNAMVYLLKYDSVYGRYDKEVGMEDGMLRVDGQAYKFFQEKDPLKLPWGKLGVDIVVEATGAFESYEKVAVHKTAGAKRVVLTAPAKDEDNPDGRTVLMGVNDEVLKTCSMSSNGSCTTNSASPVMQILVEKLGIKKAFLNTVHGYTPTQALVDGGAKDHDLRRMRAAAVNIVPSTTGAVIAVARAIDSLKGKFDGIAMRVPVVTGSLSAITFVSERPTTAEEINSILKEAENDPRWQGIYKTISDQIVSTDIIGDSYAAIADLSLTKVVDGDLCAVYSWYDNEFGYTNSLVDHVLKVAAVL